MTLGDQVRYSLKSALVSASHTAGPWAGGPFMAQACQTLQNWQRKTNKSWCKWLQLDICWCPQHSTAFQRFRGEIPRFIPYAMLCQVCPVCHIMPCYAFTDMEAELFRKSPSTDQLRLKERCSSWDPSGQVIPSAPHLLWYPQQGKPWICGGHGSEAVWSPPSRNPKVSSIIQTPSLKKQASRSHSL